MARTRRVSDQWHGGSGTERPGIVYWRRCGVFVFCAKAAFGKNRSLSIEKSVEYQSQRLLGCPSKFLFQIEARFGMASIWPVNILIA